LHVFSVLLLSLQRAQVSARETSVFAP
jgi:hypothetical protein